MTDDEALALWGLEPPADALPAIRDALRAETARVDRPDNELLKTLCMQLFAAGAPEDALLVWRAKRSSFDAGCYVDVQLLVGAGLDATRTHLAASDAPDAPALLAALDAAVAAGDFDGWSKDEQLAFYRSYLGL